MKRIKQSSRPIGKSDLPEGARIAHILEVVVGDKVRIDDHGDIMYFDIDEDGYFAIYQEEEEDCILSVHDNEFYATLGNF